MSYYTWLLPALLLTLYAQFKVSSTFSKYAKVPAKAGLPAWQVARQVLDMNGLTNVQIQPIRGNLTDHYDPRTRILRLSESTYNSTSVAALGVAAHECGHAIQHQVGYVPLKVRGSLVPVANFGSHASWILILAGALLGSANLLTIGILAFTAVVAFQLVTLPVEFNASRRAMATLEGAGFLQQAELKQTGKVLRAAALTYVAAALTSIMQLLRLIAIYGGRRR